MVFVNALAQETADDPATIPPGLTGTSALIVTLVAAIFVGFSKLISIYVAGKKDAAQITANKDLAELHIKLTQAEMRYEALLERYTELKAAYNALQEQRKQQ